MPGSGLREGTGIRLIRPENWHETKTKRSLFWLESGLEEGSGVQAKEGPTTPGPEATFRICWEAVRGPRGFQLGRRVVKLGLGRSVWVQGAEETEESESRGEGGLNTTHLESTLQRTWKRG